MTLYLFHRLLSSVKEGFCLPGDFISSVAMHIGESNHVSQNIHTSSWNVGNKFQDVTPEDIISGPEVF